MSSDIKIKVQSFGRFLSNMVMPNIGAFIAWGIITARFSFRQGGCQTKRWRSWSVR